ncbi:MAG: S9 family peptidase [Flavobacteriales bacterium CG_4_9_14_3_um_filter_32_8]|nr:MAG: S9 family peptidase [Flavobacteriales bacterium CG_4_9_14_3_um_filter_32_8]
MMKNSIIISALLFASTNFCFAQEMKNKYLTTRVDNTVVDDYFGTKIADPYRWLEDDNSEETKRWVINQNLITEDYIEDIPFRASLKKQLTDLWDFETIGTPSKHGNYYIYSKNNGKQDQSVYYIKTGEDGKEEILLDPNTLSTDGTTSIGSLSVSKDNNYLAYDISKSGSDWSEIFVMEIASKKSLSDTIRWVKFSGISWYKNGFYYSGYDTPEVGKEYSNKNEFHKVFYHQIGTKQNDDKVIFEDKEHPLRNHGGNTTEDEHFLIISASEGTSGNSLYAKDLTKENSEFVTLVNDFDNDSWVMDNLGDTLLIFTNYNAPNNRITYTTLQSPKKETWKDFIPEKTYLLEGANFAGNKLFATYLKDVKSKIEIYKMDGSYLKDLELPGIGVSYGVSGKKDENIAYYSFTSFTTPTSSYKLNVAELTTELFFQPTIDFKSEDYITEQIKFKSKDGTLIPLFITHKKGMVMDGTNPCLLYGYGGFNISIKPSFSVVNAVFLQNGGIYAVVTLRGGSEYGEKWHKAGMLDKKQNVFDDFIGAANYLKNNKYTSTEKLAIHGRSNGGLLIGAVMTQAPNLAKVALPGVGVLDMLRFHKFTIGWAWAVEYGSSEKKEDFDNLIKYSPLHNIKKVEYPATLILTADHDDRVVPAHSFKFAAELQKQNQGKNPTLIRIESKAGHGAGKPKSKLIEEWADIWAFTFYNLGKQISKDYLKK